MTRGLEETELVIKAVTTSIIVPRAVVVVEAMAGADDSGSAALLHDLQTGPDPGVFGRTGKLIINQTIDRNRSEYNENRNRK